VRKTNEGYEMSLGRPRTNCPEDEELIELGKELVEWSKNDNPEDLRWCNWHSPKGILRKTWEQMIQKEAFRIYYEEAQHNLARKWLRCDVHHSIAHRFLWMYCPDLKKDEVEKMEIEANVKKTKDESEAHNIANAINNLVDSKKEEKNEL